MFSRLHRKSDKPDAGRTQLEDTGLAWGGQRQESSKTVPAGQVISSEPNSGEKISSSTPVVLVVSTGYPTAEIPPVQGQKSAAYIAQLVALGFATKEVPQDARAGAGTVLSVVPAVLTTARLDTVIEVQVATGFQSIPAKIVGSTQSAATKALTKAGFSVQVAKAPGFGIKPGTVLAMAPEHRAPTGSVITLGVAEEQAKTSAESPTAESPSTESKRASPPR